LLLLACGGARPEAVSLLGAPLVRAELPEATRRERERLLDEARAAHERHPEDPEAWIWLGRRTAYLGRYREAVAIFGRAIARHPSDPRLYRHRGHRYLTLREIPRAIEDLERAARLIEGTPDEVEPDGLPNARNLPRSTLHANVWYHLGLAHYLLGQFEDAARCYRECLEVSTNPDMLCATSHWLYMTLRRLGRESEARALLEPIEESLDVIENGAYHELLLMYRGLRSGEALLAAAFAGEAELDAATIGYGVGNWHLVEGREREAERVFRRVVERGTWAAFGHLAAEAELRRLAAAP
jgi:tetratricopeptide (TPR) repeat protein